MLVKICGITTESAALAATEAGADFIGFVFAKSKRQISIDTAARICQGLPKTVKKVGVFVNSSIAEMNEIARIVGLDVIQLHGDESAEIATMLPYEIIKAFPATKEMLGEAKKYPADYILVDTPSKKQRGGSGEVANWKLIREANLDKSKLILAGGLNSDNVRSGIAAVQPAGVDVSSGVETNGEKNNKKIIEFIKCVKE